MLRGQAVISPSGLNDSPVSPKIPAFTDANDYLPIIQDLEDAAAYPATEAELGAEIPQDVLDVINPLQSTTTYLRADPLFEGEEPGIVYLPQDVLDNIDNINDNAEKDPSTPY